MNEQFIRTLLTVKLSKRKLSKLKSQYILTLKSLHQKSDRSMHQQSQKSSFLQLHTSQNLLQQEIAQLSHTIQIKQNKISYLQSQLRSIKLEYAQRLQLIENTYNELKKQNQHLEKRYLEEKHVDSLQLQQKMKNINDQQRNSNAEKDKVYQKMIKDQQEKFQGTLKNVENKYESIVKKLKDQNKSLQNILLAKKHDSFLSPEQQVGKQFTFGTDEYRYLSASPNLSNLAYKDMKNNPNESNLMKEKTQLLQELYVLKQKHQKLLKELQTEKKINLQMQSDHRTLKSQLQEEIEMIRRQADNLNRRIQTLEQQKQTNKKVYTQKIFDLERRNDRVHTHMKEIDETYLLALTNRTREQKPSPVTAIKTCNHAGLIAQLQRNIEINDQQIERLNNKINHLEKMLGLNKGINQRLHEIGNVSDRTLQIYKSQKEKIFNKTTKLAKR